MRHRFMILIVLVALPISVMSQPVTMELTATVSYIGNNERQGSIYVGPAVNDSSIPFQLGDEVRFIFTYDPTSIATAWPDQSGPCQAWYFEDAIISAALYADLYSNSWSRVLSSPVVCGHPNEHGFRIQISPFNAEPANTVALEDLPFRNAEVALHLNPACFGTVPPVLPTTGFTPENNCQLAYSTGGEIVLEWAIIPDFNYRRVVTVVASQNAALAFPTNAAPTPADSDVSLNPVVPLPDGELFTTVQISFESVLTSGTTSVAASDTPADGVSTPTGFTLGDPAVYFDVDTTATYSGDVELCFYWQPGQFLDEATARLLHYENGTWQDVTVSRDVVANKVCGSVTTLSPFAIVERSFAFDGFFPPVDNQPIVNVAKAGASIPIKFDLNGNQGTEIFFSGFPASQSIACDANTPSDVISETATAGTSGLSYDATSDLYTYVWKSDKTWSQSCRRFLLKFRDGSVYSADFRFQK